jgi:hypothetical protein
MWWRVWSTESLWTTGAHQINHRGQEIPAKKYVDEEGKEKIWEHALKVTS